MGHKPPYSKWYFEGQQAAKENKSTTECPYKEGSYGHSEWNRGYNEFTTTMEE
jgi:hypothetical protein